MPRKPPAHSEPGDYRRWKTDAEALLVRLGIPAGPWSRERDLRQLFIRGATPEQAAEQIQNALLEYPLVRAHAAKAITDELPFKVVRSTGTDEVLVRAMNLLIGRAAYREAARLYPGDLIELRHGAHVIEKSK
jgi:hypothetical protein